MAVLLFESGPEKGRKFELKEDFAYTAGRDPRCDIVLPDELAAPVHFRIKGVGGVFYIRAEKTEAGTLVNDEKHAQLSLTAGDKIQAGDTILSFVEPARANGFIGREIGGYRITDHLGRGGMGSVFLAIQISLNREVALKTLSPRLTRDPDFVRKFTEEARAAAALSHPNVIQVYDVGHDGKYRYYSMEFAEGGTVEELVNSGEPIPVTRAIEIIRHAAAGLRYAESIHLVHHDIKPQNLMIDKFGVTKIADMGLAASLEDSGKVDNEIIGTPHFISPERILRKELDIRSDMYSLGCTFYWILTGRTPFTGDTTRDILRKQLKEEPVPIREIRPDVPDAVCSVVGRLMRKSPDERYPDISALIAELGELKEKGKGRGMLALVAVILIAGAAAAYFFLSGGKPDKTEQDLAGEATTETATPAPTAGDDLETQKKMAELEATNVYLSIPFDIEPEKRLARLDSIVSRFPGTKTAQKASLEADGLRGQMDRDARKAEESRKRIADLRTRVEREVSSLVREKRYYEAMLAAQEVGAADKLSDSPEVVPIRDAMIESVSRAVAIYTDGVLKESGDRASRGEYEEAVGVARKAGRALLPPDTIESPMPFLLLKSKREAIEAAAEAIEEQCRTERVALLDKDLATLDDWTDTGAEREAILALSSEAPQAFPAMATPGYVAYIESLAARHRALASLIGRFRKAVTDGVLENNAVKHPIRNDACTILGLSDDGASLRLSVGGMSIVNVPLTDFARPAAFVDLVDRRFALSGADLVAMARAAILLSAARAGADLAPVAEAVAGYGKAGSWDDTLKAKAGKATLPDTSFVDAVSSLLDRAVAADPALDADCRKVLDAAFREKAAMETLAEALAPFVEGESDVLFQDSVDRLHIFVTEYTDTLFFRHTAELVGGSRREGGHLVECSP
jgi:pSer/pThr/pTyr-binding forkhead associated (FHA) protein